MHRAFSGLKAFIRSDSSDNGTPLFHPSTHLASSDWDKALAQWRYSISLLTCTYIYILYLPMTCQKRVYPITFFFWHCCTAAPVLSLLSPLAKTSSSLLKDEPYSQDLHLFFFIPSMKFHQPGHNIQGSDVPHSRWGTVSNTRIGIPLEGDQYPHKSRSAETARAITGWSSDDDQFPSIETGLHDGFIRLTEDRRETRVRLVGIILDAVCGHSLLKHIVTNIWHTAYCA
jgi:hypothetical protein